MHAAEGIIYKFKFHTSMDSISTNLYDLPMLKYTVHVPWKPGTQIGVIGQDVERCAPRQALFLPDTLNMTGHSRPGGSTSS